MANKGSKAIWNVQTTLFFCDVCIKAIDKDMRPGSHFNANGWKFVVDNFQQISRLHYDRKMLKNKWNQLKSDWKLWKELKGKETGLGWDSRFETVDATPEWWASKIAVNKDYAKFCKKGIHHDIESKLDVMFGQSVATGEFCYESAAPEEQEVEIDRQHESYEPVDESMQSSRLPSSSSQTQCGKRKVTSAFGSGFEDSLNLLATSIQQNITDVEGCSIREVMTELAALPGIDCNSELYYFAITLFRQKTNRIIFKELPTVERKLGWMKYLLEASKRD